MAAQDVAVSRAPFHDRAPALVAGVNVALLLAASVRAAVAPPTGVDESWGAGASVVLAPIALLAYPLVGGLIATRRRGNAIGWLLLVSGLAWGVTFAVPTPTSSTIDGVDGFLVAWVGSLGWWVPALGITATVALQLFPDGRPVSDRWRRLVWLSGAAMVIVAFLVTVTPTLGTDGPTRPNPYAVSPLSDIASALSPLFGLFPLSIVGSVASLVVRYRRTSGDQRLQIKWLGLAAGGLASIYAVTVALTLATEGPEGVPAPVSVLQSATLVSYGTIPAAIGVAVLRYRLYDIDRIISRTLTYAVVTGGLVAVYAGLVFVLSGIARTLTGSADIAVAGSTLVVAALVRPVLTRTRTRIDHRFNRARYDAIHTVDAFAERLRREIDIDALEAELRDVVGRTMHPATASLWLRHR